MRGEDDGSWESNVTNEPGAGHILMLILKLGVYQASKLEQIQANINFKAVDICSSSLEVSRWVFTELKKPLDLLNVMPRVLITVRQCGGHV